MSRCPALFDVLEELPASRATAAGVKARELGCHLRLGRLVWERR
jgi:hypothetical protein